MNYKILERYTGINKEDFLEIKNSGKCPHSISMLEECIRQLEAIKAEKEEKEADILLKKL